jgi:hypothetical protein
MPINIRAQIQKVLQGYSSGAVFAFLGVLYYGHSTQVISSILKVKHDVVTDWITQIRSDIRLAYKGEGGHISEDGVTVDWEESEDVFESFGSRSESEY